MLLNVAHHLQSTGYQTVDRFTVLSGGTDEAPTQAQVDLTSSDTPVSYTHLRAHET